MRIQPIILAAGKGTRMGNPDLPKVLIEVKGRPIISYLIDSVKNTGFLKPVLVIGYHQDKVREALGDSCRYIVQEEQLGTGHAVLACQKELEGTADVYIIMYGDHALWTTTTMCCLADEHQETGATLSLVTLRSKEEEFFNFGRILRDAEGTITGIRELKDCTEEEKAIDEYNPGMYCVNDDWLWGALSSIKSENAQHEYYLTDLLEIAIREKKRIAWAHPENWQEAIGINTPQQLEEVGKYL